MEPSVLIYDEVQNCTESKLNDYANKTLSQDTIVNPIVIGNTNNYFSSSILFRGFLQTETKIEQTFNMKFMT